MPTSTTNFLCTSHGLPTYDDSKGLGPSHFADNSLCETWEQAQAREKGVRITKKDETVIDHPAHYTKHPSGVECIDITEHMNFNLGNAIKYVWRSGEKGDRLEDLKKARWYIDREIARLEKS